MEKWCFEAIDSQEFVFRGFIISIFRVIRFWNLFGLLLFRKATRVESENRRDNKTRIFQFVVIHDCSLKSIRRYLGLVGSRDNSVLISPGRIVSLRYFYIVILERSRAIRRARTNSKMNKRQSAGKGREEKFEIRVQSRLAF